MRVFRSTITCRRGPGWRGGVSRYGIHIVSKRGGGIGRLSAFRIPSFKMLEFIESQRSPNPSNLSFLFKESKVSLLPSFPSLPPASLRYRFLPCPLPPTRNNHIASTASPKEFNPTTYRYSTREVVPSTLALRCIALHSIAPVVLKLKSSSLAV